MELLGGRNFVIAWGVALAAVLASFVLAFVAVSYERELRFPTIFARRLRERRDICSCTTVQKAKRSGVDACLKPHRAWRP